MKANLGVIGLGVMGQNLILNLLSKNYIVAGFSTKNSETEEFVRTSISNSNFLPTFSLEDFISKISLPRKVLLVIKSGPPVDEILIKILPLLQKEDIIVDCGNSFYKETNDRIKESNRYGVEYLGAGISGGEEGARCGASVMSGGSRKAYELSKQIFQDLSAHIDNISCSTYIGPGGSGHFVKMVHNGIEYAYMQLISEIYSLLKNIKNFSSEDVSQVFKDWSSNEKLNSYLIEITPDILSFMDQKTGQPLIEFILDKAAQKGTGNWSVQSALDLGVAIPTIGAAVFERSMSMIKEERVKADKYFENPEVNYFDKEIINILQDALYAAKILVFAQGFSLIKSASINFGWDIDFARIAEIWRAGCIIRSTLLDKIKIAFKNDKSLPNIIFDPSLKQELENAVPLLRKTVALGVTQGIALPGLSSTLSYFDSYRTGNSSANLIQAQRDYFGAHTYERNDMSGTFHTKWKNRLKV